MKNNGGNGEASPSCLCKHSECALCGDDLLGELSQEQVCQVHGTVRKVNFQAREILFREGDPVTQLFELRSGQAKLSSSMHDGREQILRLGVPGHLLGFESIDNDVYYYTAEAVSPVEACAIHQQDIRHAIKKHPGVLRRIAKRLAQELEQAEEMIRVLGMKKSEERVASFLLSLVTDQTDLNENVPLHLSRHDIAKILGMTTETVSRVMTKLQREAVIVSPRGSVRILDHERLLTKSGARLSGI